MDNREIVTYLQEHLDEEQFEALALTTIYNGWRVIGCHIAGKTKTYRLLFDDLGAERNLVLNGSGREEGMKPTKVDQDLLYMALTLARRSGSRIPECLMKLYRRGLEEQWYEREKPAYFGSLIEGEVKALYCKSQEEKKTYFEKSLQMIETQMKSQYENVQIQYKKWIGHSLSYETVTGEKKRVLIDYEENKGNLASATCQSTFEGVRQQVNTLQDAEMFARKVIRLVKNPTPVQGKSEYMPNPVLTEEQFEALALLTIFDGWAVTGCREQAGTKIYSLIYKNLGFPVKVILNAQNQSFSESQYPRDQYLIIDNTEMNLQFMGKRMITVQPTQVPKDLKALYCQVMDYYGDEPDYVFPECLGKQIEDSIEEELKAVVQQRCKLFHQSFAYLTEQMKSAYGDLQTTERHGLFGILKFSRNSQPKELWYRMVRDNGN